MKNEKLKDQIDKYLLGDLDESEKAKFLEELKQYPELEKQLQMDLDIYQSVKYAANKENKAILEKLHVEEFGRASKGKIVSMKSILSVAAVFVVGLLCFQFLFKSTMASTDSSELFAAYYKPYETTFQTRGDIDETVKKIKKAYISKDYSGVLNLVDNINIDKNIELKLVAGVSAMEIGYPTKAALLFEEVIQSENYYFKDHALWYGALAYIKQDEKTKAKLYLALLAEDAKADHHKEAQQLLNKLN